VRATVDALEQLRTPAEVAAIRGKSVEEVLGARLTHAAETGNVGVSAVQWADQHAGETSATSAATETTTTDSDAPADDAAAGSEDA
jgi:hypothetical protein